MDSAHMDFFARVVTQLPVTNGGANIYSNRAERLLCAKTIKHVFRISRCIIYSVHGNFGRRTSNEYVVSHETYKIKTVSR